MVSDRPLNHVQQALEEHRKRLQGNPAVTLPEPSWTKEQIEWMEKTYPPRCLGLHEAVEDHLRYAGIASFVAARRAHFEAMKDLGDDPDEIEHV